MTTIRYTLVDEAPLAADERWRPRDREFVRQSEEYAAAWKGKGLRGRYLPVPKHGHFSILEELAHPQGAILAALKEVAFSRG